MTTPFVARAAEVGRLLAAVDAAAAGRPSTVLLGGDAGVGKTRLVPHLADLATERGATVVTAACVDLGEVGVPYLPFADALGRLRARGPAVDRLLRERPALARLVPPAGERAEPVAADDEAARLQLFDGLASVLAASGRDGAPLVLVLEDLHWADSSSRDVLRYLAARLRTEHVVVIGTYRTDDLHRRHPLRPVVAELARHPRVEHLELRPFTADELADFAVAVAGCEVAEPRVRTVMERSEGNAYFAQELLESEGDTVPWSLGDVLRARIDTLDPAVVDVARLVAVSGRTVAEPLLRAVWHRWAGSTPQGAGAPDAALDRAVRARDATCRWPGCLARAARCDLDHTVPFPDGPTAACNLACLCRLHHRAKHRAGWLVLQGPLGRLDLVSPTGRVHVTEPTTWHRLRPGPGDDHLVPSR